MSTMHFIASYCSVSMTKRARPNPTACIGFRDVFLFKLLTQCLIGLSCVNAFWHDPSSSSLPLQSPLSLPTIVRTFHAVCRWTHAPVINGFDQWVVNLPRHKFASCSSLSAFNQTNDTINQRRV